MDRLRTFLACLLLVALPLQGALAASMRSCLPLAQADITAGVAHAVDHQGGHHHAAGHGDHSSGHLSAKADLPGSQHQCDICEACGHAAALSAQPAALAASIDVLSHPAMAPPRVDTLGLPVPDKPPRA